MATHKKRWALKPSKATTAMESEIARLTRLHNRHNELTQAIEAVRCKLAIALDFETERTLMAQLCDLEIELGSVAECLAET